MMPPVTICCTQLGVLARAPDLDHRHRGCSEQCAEANPASARETTAADDDGRNHIELQTIGHRGIADREAGELEHPRDAGQGAPRP